MYSFNRSHCYFDELTVLREFLCDCETSAICFALICIAYYLNKCYKYLKNCR